MNVRALVAIGLLAVPCALDAQIQPRRPRIGGDRGPDRPAPLPPQPAEIVRQIQYQQMRVSFETYPFVSRVRSPGFTASGEMSSWTSFGIGTRADYRVNPRVSVTLDVTSSFAGGPATTETAEFGVRLRPTPSESRIRPYLDLRAGYAHSYSRTFRLNGMTDAWQSNYGSRYSQGVGATAGGGFELPLTRTWALTSAASVTRMQLTGYRYAEGWPSRGEYPMTAYRYQVGLKYNPVRRIMTMPSTSTQH